MNFKIVGIGEVLWDLLPGGRQLGGAPANFAYHACALGAEGRIISRVGDDQKGRDIIERLQRLRVPTDCIELDPQAPTGTVSVEISHDGQPRFIIHENVAWDRIVGGQNARRAIAEAHAICFGTLAQRQQISRAAIQSLLRLAPSRSLRIFDVNLRQHFYSTEVIDQSLRVANVLKVNDAELPILAKLLQLTGDARAQIPELAHRYHLQTVACTRGDHGSLLFSNGCWSEHPGISTKVVDTVGAGDSFTASMALGLLAGWDLDDINHRANQVASYVASCAGATPKIPPGLQGMFQPG